jgi:hypothetical protein
VSPGEAQPISVNFDQAAGAAQSARSAFVVVIVEGIKCLTLYLGGPSETTRLEPERSLRRAYCSCLELASWGQELRYSDLQPTRLQPSGLERVP